MRWLTFMIAVIGSQQTALALPELWVNGAFNKDDSETFHSRAESARINIAQNARFGSLLTGRGEIYFDALHDNLLSIKPLEKHRFSLNEVPWSKVSNVYNRFSFDVQRLWLKHEKSGFALTAGRQEISLGTHHTLLNLLDIINPLNFYDITYNARVGADAVTVAYVFNDQHRLGFSYLYQKAPLVTTKYALLAHSSSYFSLLSSEVHTLAARVLDTTIFGLSSWHQYGPLGLALEGGYYHKKGEKSFGVGSARPELTFYKKNKFFMEYVYNAAATTPFEFPFLPSQNTLVFFDHLHNLGGGIVVQPATNFSIDAMVVHKGSTRTSYSKFDLEYRLQERLKVKAAYVDNFSESTRSYYLLAQYHFS